MIDNTYAYRELLGQAPNAVFDAVTINIASPEVIRSWSHGEVKNPETINYRTFKPEKGGLFCDRIFGPTRDWECNCGKYTRVKHKGVICDRCGVEVTQSKVRRERLGHIELAVPVSHIWFFKCMPSRIGLMLDMTARVLERIIYYEDWCVIDGGDTPLKPGQSLTESEYREAREDYGDAFKADMGAAAIRTLLERIDLEKTRDELLSQLEGAQKTLRKKITKKLRLVEGFIKSNARPEWMILEVLPVIPPDLRPLVPLEGGRFATSDLNDLYRRVINRNNRLKNLLQLRTPEVIIRNEKRMLQEAVDALLDNGRHGRPVTGSGNRPLKSLSEMLKGKQGRFRQNLLGKRVDYSGRSVIVVGPELKLHQCGLPKKMALTLFEPFIIRFLKSRGKAHTVKGAKKMIAKEDPVVWDILEEVIQGHPVLLNRAPTLHRLSIQAFDPILIEGSAIRLHPLVCTAYNADFDGDQMAVHIPLSNESQMESKLIMLSSNNIFSPANGKPITTPTQDITLGVYYLTYHPNNPEKPRALKNYFEVLCAMDAGVIKIHDAIKIPNPDYKRDTLWGNPSEKFIITTPGRCIFNEIWDDSLGFYNDIVKKKKLGQLINDAYEKIGHEKLVKLLDDLKDLGYKYATIAGFSISITDLVVPDSKPAMIEEAKQKVAEIQRQYEEGVLTTHERGDKIKVVWTDVSNRVAQALINSLDKNLNKGEINPVFAMLDSGARGSQDQIRQLAGMRGLMAKPSGEIIERPIISNFRDGLSVLEYFISTHGARKGLADTALKTSDSGYMTRKLVDVAQDVICREEDCHSVKGIWVSALIAEGEEEMIPLSTRIVGRFSTMDIPDPVYEGEFIVRADEEITPEIAAKIEKRGIKKVCVRSVLTCETEFGVCSKCYGRNLANGKLAEIGDAVGIIAAQSIGEPGTQLTMRTFHIGGTASGAYRAPEIVIKNNGRLLLDNVRYVKDEKNKVIVINKSGWLVIEDERHHELERYPLQPGTHLMKIKGEVKAGEKIAEWDAHSVPTIAEEDGIVEFKDLVEGVSLNKSKRGKITEYMVMEHREDLQPNIVIKNEKGNPINNYPLPAGALVMVKEGQKVKVGTILARRPRQIAKNRDITGGLPRVSELFDARTPKNIAEIAKIDGIVQIVEVSTKAGRKKIIIKDPETGQQEDHNIPANKHLTVGNGDRVKKGDKLTEGAIVPSELLEVCGVQELQRYLIDEIQMVYKAQGVDINDKHIEIIVRQMMQKVKITSAGSTRFLPDEQVEKWEFHKENERVIKMGGQPAEGEPVVQGITKASLETQSFISAASFQDTTRILTEAATLSKIDYLRGFKENVITGHLIPAGTGIPAIQNIKVKKLVPDDHEVPDMQLGEARIDLPE